MTFTRVRRALFQLHMYIGLTLGILLALLGLSGSAIVYDQEIANFFYPPPQATAVGKLLPLDAIAAAARRAAGPGEARIALPQIEGRPMAVRVSPASRGGPPTRLQVFVDPVSGAVLDTRAATLPPFLAFAHRLHGNFLMGRDGRTHVVGWLGVAMCVLGLSGLVLWWPRRGQWKLAFLVRRAATGARFQRELHAATGIWVFIVFMAVSFSGVVLAWPQTFGLRQAGVVSRIVPSGRPIGADRALALAMRALPGAEARSITLPAESDRPIEVGLLSGGAIAANVSIDPYRARVISVRDPSRNLLAWQRPLHQGALGPVWRALVFAAGLVPSLFLVTGLAMWWKKRKQRVAMNMPLAEEAVA